MLVAADVPRRPQKLQKQSQRSTVKLYLTGRQSGRRRRARFSPVLSTHKAVSSLIFASVLLTNVKKLQFFHSAAPPPRRPLYPTESSGCCDTTSSHQTSSSLVFYTLSPTTEDTFCPCPAFPRSPPSTCLKRSLPSQPYSEEVKNEMLMLKHSSSKLARASN